MGILDEVFHRSLGTGHPSQQRAGRCLDLNVARSKEYRDAVRLYVRTLLDSPIPSLIHDLEDLLWTDTSNPAGTERGAPVRSRCADEPAVPVSKFAAAAGSVNTGLYNRRHRVPALIQEYP